MKGGATLPRERRYPYRPFLPGQQYLFKLPSDFDAAKVGEQIVAALRVWEAVERRRRKNNEGDS